MRTEITILIIPLGIGFAVSLAAAYSGVAASWLFFPFGPATGLLIGVCILMAYNAMYSVRELVKQIATWLGIVVLLPLSVWDGVCVVSSPPDWKQFQKSNQKLEEKIRTANGPEKQKLEQEKDQREQELDEHERVFYRHMFRAAYPVGLLAIIVGIFYPVQAVGAGLMFGGLFSLTSGCYSYWDRMGDQLRLGSLVIALVVFFVLGTWRFRPLRSDNALLAEAGAARENQG